MPGSIVWDRSSLSTHLTRREECYDATSVRGRSGLLSEARKKISDFLFEWIECFAMLTVRASILINSGLLVREWC